MTAVFIILIVIMCFLILNGTESILQELNRVEDRQEALYTMVLGKVNGIKTEMDKMKNAEIDAAKKFDAGLQSEYECLKDLQEILTVASGCMQTMAEEMGSSVLDEPETENDDQSEESV